MLYDRKGKPIPGCSIFDATKVTASNQLWFSGNSADVYATIGQVMACTSGEKFFWNGTNSATEAAAIKRVCMLSHLPNADSIYDTSVTVGETLTANEDGSYTATADGAIFFPIRWSNGSTFETHISNGYVYLGGGNWFITTGGTADPYYLKNYPVNHLFNQNPSPLDLAGLLKNFIPMIGSKAAVLGNSLCEQSAGYTGGKDSYGFNQGLYNSDGWFSRIARKYGMEYRVHGYGTQWWYCTDARPNGGVKAVNSLIESGYVPDYIVLEYGTNDIWTGTLGAATDIADAAATSTVGAMRYCIETLQANFPSAKIIVIMPCMRGVNDAKQEEYYELVKPILREYGVRYVDMLGETGIVKAMMNPDGVHLATLNADNTYNNDTDAVKNYSRCLEAAMLMA